MASGIGGTMSPEKSDGSDLRWKRPETKADESRDVRRFWWEESKQRED